MGKNKVKEKGKTGPKPDTLKIPGDWEEKIGQAIKKKRPKGGWPKPKDKEKSEN